MTYYELYNKALAAFDTGKRVITGYPVEVLCRISRLADSQGWDQPVDADKLRIRLSPDYLDVQSVAAVLGILQGSVV